MGPISGNFGCVWGIVGRLRGRALHFTGLQPPECNADSDAREATSVTQQIKGEDGAMTGIQQVRPTLISYVFLFLLLSDVKQIVCLLFYRHMMIVVDNNDDDDNDEDVSSLASPCVWVGMVV